MHRQSKGNDLGYQNLWKNERSGWHFRINFFDRTLVLLQFLLDIKDATFDYFNEKT